MNAYFRLVISQAGTELEFFPATEGDSPIDINEVISYLQFKKITQYDIKAIVHALQQLSQGEEPVRMLLQPQQILPENETCFLKVSEDKMTVTARFIAPSDKGQKMDKREMLRDFAMQHINTGIKMDVLEDFLENRQYCTDLIVAEGTEPRHGTDASITYFFNTDLRAKPARREDGSVDFFNLNTINHCKKGDLLARLTPEDKGDYGVNVFGEKIKPRDVKRLSLKFGKNITLSEDKLEIYSDINGHVALTDDKVFVSDVYEVENVGTATGNINSEGSVVVSGNVQAGFCVEASGNVEVRGVVEGASITAGGDIIIARGVNGMGKGFLKAGRNVIAKFVENATIEAGECVEADSIMHSKVSARTEITVDGRKGFITGSTVRATNQVSCKTLGSELGVYTLVEVGVDPQQKARYLELQKSRAEQQKKLATIQTTLSGAAAKMKTGTKFSPEQMQYIRSLAQVSEQMKEQLQKDNEEYEELEQILGSRSQACVCVHDVAYAGSKIVIGEDSVILKGNVRYSRFVNDGGEVRVHAM
jgi:hypothetical protein